MTEDPEPTPAAITFDQIVVWAGCLTLAQLILACGVGWLVVWWEEDGPEWLVWWALAWLNLVFGVRGVAGVWHAIREVRRGQA